MSTALDRPATPRLGKRLAVVIGVNEAPESGKPPLKHALDDAKAMAEALKLYSKFELLKPPLLGRKATSDKVKDAVLDLINEREADDFLLLYFAGHGQEMQVGTNDYDGYLVTSDFSTRRAEQDETRYVSMSWLRDKLFVGTNAGNVLIILDCCYAGAMGRTASDHFLEKLLNNIVYYLEGPGRELERHSVGLRWAMVAADYNQTAEERRGHGVMTRLLLHALRGEINELLDDEGHLTLGRLHDYLTKKMPADQRPGMSGNNPGKAPCILAWHSGRASLVLGKPSHTMSIDRPKNYIPFPRNPLFQPRPNEFEQLVHLLFGRGLKPRRLGLVGMLGLGKTELAIQLAYRYKDRFPAGIFWMTAMGNSLFDWQPLLAKLAAYTAYLPPDDDASHPEKELRRAQYFCNYLANHSDALLILDQVEEPSLAISNLFALAGEDIACTILYTSRNTSVLPGVTIYPVEPLPEKGALHLLLETTRESLLAEISTESQNAEAKAARAVCQGVGCLPLALVYLQGLLAQNRSVTLVRLAEVLRERGVLDTIKTYEEDAAPLFEMFRLNWEQVHGKDAQRLFKLASYFREAAPIPLWLLGLAAGLGERGDIFEPLGKACVQLKKLSLLEGLSEDHVRMHPLVRAFGRRLVTEDPLRATLLAEAGKRLTDEFEYLNRLERRAQSTGYWGCMEQVEAVRKYAELLGSGPGEQLGRIERWLARESYLLGDGKLWPEIIPGLFYQQIFNRSVEEGHPLPESEALTPWLRQEEKVGVEDRSLLRVFAGHVGEVRSVAFSPDSTKVLTGSVDGTARLWEVASGKVLATLEGHTETVTSVAFSPNGEKIVTGSDDQTAQIWETASGKLLATLQAHTDRMTCVTFSPDPNGKWILTGSDDGTARLWETANGKLLTTLEGHTGGVWSVAFSPDPNGKWILTGSDDGTARLWETANGKLLTTLEGHTDALRSVAFSPDERWVLTGSNDRTARLSETASGNLIRMLKGHIDMVTSVAFSPDGRKVVTGSTDQTVRLWETTSGDLLTILKGHTGGVRSVAFSPDGRWVLTGSDDRTARLWETAGRNLQASLETHIDRIRSVAFSPDGRWVLTGSDDRTARLWETATGNLLVTLKGHTGGVRSVAFSPDGRWILTGSDDRTARLWETTSGNLLTILKDHTDEVRSVAFSPDGMQVLTGSNDGTARLWNTMNGELQATLRGHTDRIRSVAFSPDGTKVLTGSDDRTVWLWETTSGNLLAILKGHTGWITSVAFSRDGNLAITCDQHGRVLLWWANGGKLLGIYVATYEIGAVHWQHTTQVILADMGGPRFRPHFYRLTLEGID